MNSIVKDANLGETGFWNGNRWTWNLL